MSLGNLEHLWQERGTAEGEGQIVGGIGKEGSIGRFIC